MELDKARKKAEEIEEQLRPVCDKIAIAGSIRRQKDWVRDIDMVAIPSNQGMFLTVLQSLGRIRAGGGKIIRVGMGFTKGIDLDMYVATPETWATILLIRTGSAAHNRKLCLLARSKNMVLHADGSGLFKLEAQGCEGVEVRIAGDTETQIFEKLGLSYVAPEKRE
jgi:DNA polymerase/3'-5' exonuclease PolX